MKKSLSPCRPDLRRTVAGAMRLLVSLAVMSSPLLGCAAGPESMQGTEDRPALKANGLTINALTHNALTANALTADALTADALTNNALTADALSGNALTASALEDPLARELLSYVVSCALTADTEIDITVAGVGYTFEGQLGLSAGWGDEEGTCDAYCRAWVSACVLARVDYLGVHVPLSVRGARKQLATTTNELQDYPNREATYWGDIFASPQIRKACLSPGETQIPRVCGPSIEGCVMDVVGSCDDVCGHWGKDGVFGGCGEDPVSDLEITVFLE